MTITYVYVYCKVIERRSMLVILSLQKEGQKAPSLMVGMHRLLPMDRHLF